MDQRVSMITLGVADVGRAKTFYERLGWQGQTVQQTVFFQLAGWRLSCGAVRSLRTTPVLSTRGQTSSVEWHSPTT